MFIMFMITDDQMMFGIEIQWSLYFKITHGTKKMWSYVAGVLNMKVISNTEWHFGSKLGGLHQGWSYASIKGGLKIKGCKLEGPLYN